MHVGEEKSLDDVIILMSNLLSSVKSKIPQPSWEVYHNRILLLFLKLIVMGLGDNRNLFEEFREIHYNSTHPGFLFSNQKY